VFFTTGFADELAKAGLEVRGGLKAIAEHLGWRYKDHSFKERGKVRHIAVVTISWEEFIDFLIGEVKEEQTQTSTSCSWVRFRY
jgi:hypothetical protein